MRQSVVNGRGLCIINPAGWRGPETLSSLSRLILMNMHLHTHTHVLLASIAHIYSHFAAHRLHQQFIYIFKPARALPCSHSIPFLNWIQKLDSLLKNEFFELFKCIYVISNNLILYSWIVIYWRYIYLWYLKEYNYFSVFAKKIKPSFVQTFVSVSLHFQFLVICKALAPSAFGLSFVPCQAMLQRLTRRKKTI